MIPTKSGTKMEDVVLIIRSMTKEKFKRTEKGLKHLLGGDTEVRTDRGKAGETKLEKSQSKFPAVTTKGSNEVPIQRVDLLGPKSTEQLIRAIDKVMKANQVLDDSHKCRMKLIYKGKGDRADANSYRPITGTSEAYRLAMQAIKGELQAWVEGNDILGEPRNIFRRGRRLDDILFVLTQCIGVSMAQKRPQ